MGAGYICFGGKLGHICIDLLPSGISVGCKTLKTIYTTWDDLVEWKTTIEVHTNSKYFRCQRAYFPTHNIPFSMKEAFFFCITRSTPIRLQPANEFNDATCASYTDVKSMDIPN